MTANASWIDDLGELDRAVYDAIVKSRTPWLDGAMSRLSVAANYSRLSFLAAAALSLTRGEPGREAAKLGIASLAATSAVANLVLKPLGGRARPDRAEHGREGIQRVGMPASASLPSGHTAAAVAFANGVGAILPREGGALRVLAAAVAYSRVHTGVHYPSDVLLGALTGKIISWLVVRRLRPSG
jgi:membrane-associated phospholipid phosphatase